MFEDTGESIESHEFVESPERGQDEKTLLIIKPDAIERDLIAEIFEFIKQSGFEVEEQAEVALTEEIVYKFWPKIYGQDWIDRSITYLTSKPVIACVLTGKGVIDTMLECKRSLRKKYPNDDPVVTVIHSSDSPEEFEREYNVLFRGV